MVPGGTTGSQSVAVDLDRRARGIFLRPWAEISRSELHPDLRS
jgi:hypothetical protein